MKNLKKILLAGSLVLFGCEDKNLLTSEDFNNSNWISAPFAGNIWHSYVGENVSAYDRNWSLYQEKVAEKNGFTYKINEKGFKQVIYNKEKVLLPDLNNDGKVQYSKGLYALADDRTNSSYQEKTRKAYVGH